MDGNASATARGDEREKKRDNRGRTGQTFGIWETFLAGDLRKAPEAAEKQGARVPRPDRRQVADRKARKDRADPKSEAPAHRSILRADRKKSRAD